MIPDGSQQICFAPQKCTGNRCIGCGTTRMNLVIDSLCLGIDSRKFSEPILNIQCIKTQK